LTSAAAEDGHIEAVESELTHAALSVPLEYLRGFRDGAFDLYERVNGGNGAGLAGGTAAAQFVDTSAFMWVLQATEVFTSTQSGLGMPVAILDTGFDLQHPDFVGRRITATATAPTSPKSRPARKSVEDMSYGYNVVGSSAGGSLSSPTWQRLVRT
jgi:subtilisin family serine protease